MKALWETSFGTDANRFWVLQNIVASVEPFRGQELPKTGLCLRLPIGAGDEIIHRSRDGSRNQQQQQRGKKVSQASLPGPRPFRAGLAIHLPK